MIIFKNDLGDAKYFVNVNIIAERTKFMLIIVYTRKRLSKRKLFLIMCVYFHWGHL